MSGGCPDCGGELKQQGPFKECVECGKLIRDSGSKPTNGFDETIMEMI